MSFSVLVIDDSAVVRQILRDTLSAHEDIEVLPPAPDPLFALERMKSRWPDVIVLDIEMPRMDGLTFLETVMATRPTPVVVCSSLAESGSEPALRALSAGAFAVVAKPKLGVRDFLESRSDDLVTMVREASKARAGQLRTSSRTPIKADSPSSGPAPKLSADHVLAPPGSRRPAPMTERVVAIGCSTGGTLALEEILVALPRTCPGIVVVQHMPEAFTRGFAKRLDGICQIEVREAATGDRILPGLALIAPGGRHLLVVRSGAQYRVEVREGPLVSRHRPSVDVLFRSVAGAAGRNATGFILTGMGDDGARGMKEMFDAGSRCYAQDEQSSVVYGMPKEAVRMGGVHKSVPLEEVAGIIADLGRGAYS
ncbi:MAG: chemotaxis response regulator protein-glutamate methylesterase [Fibrobacteria bacterium]|nr:chemotaxis response regulator protein-glutamate methylesterase [Fibrobacteria bacterium]